MVGDSREELRELIQSRRAQEAAGTGHTVIMLTSLQGAEAAI